MPPRPLTILFEKFGRIPLSGSDLVNLCHRCDIEIVMSRDVTRGFYYFSNNKHTIVLSTRLARKERQFVAFHEFAHFLQNYYERRTVAAFSNVDPTDPAEKLADIFAMIATQPDQIKITGPKDFLRMLMGAKSENQNR